MEPNQPGDRGAEPDETFTRRVCAVLLADVSGFSALMGVDDEGTARAVRRLQTLIQEVVADAGGRADAFAGDAIFAIFDSVVAAVDAALTIHRRIAEQVFAGRRLQVRVGIHLGDVLLREGAPVSTAVGDAINVAARLQTLAKPGTVCISDGVYRQVRNRFDARFVDLGRQQLKNISEPMHAYLIIPREAEVAKARAPRRSAVAWGLGAAALVLIAAAGVVTLLRERVLPPERPKPPAAGTQPGAGAGMATRQPEGAAPVVEVAAEPGQDAQQVALGVMLFKRLGAEGEQDWRREALRDGLNAQLSQLSQVKVYSKEFIDFLMSRKGLTDIEAASQLGIKKMLSGSFVALGGMLRIETHVVDVATGVLEASYTTEGREQDFLDLQNKMTMGVISHLNLPVTPEEKRTLLARQSTNVEALKMLLEAEAGAAVLPPERVAPPSSKSAPRSALPQWWASRGLALAAEAVEKREERASRASARVSEFIALKTKEHSARPEEPPSFWRRLEGLCRRKWTAPAAVADDTQVAIIDVLERYRRATEARELQALASVYAEFPPEQQAAQQRYFENVKDLKVTIDNVDVAVVGDEAVASYTRTDDFVDARTGRPMHVAVRLTKILRRTDGTWKLAGK